jgi:cellulose biosynthesis protein BcsQ
VFLALWSPKGGSGTSVVAASLALVAATRGHARLADLGGDQPAILGLGAGPWAPGAVDGLSGWLATGPSAPTEWLEGLALPVAPGLALLPRGTRPLEAASPEAGAALAVALRDGATTILDGGAAACPAARAAAEVADRLVVVLRPCYLALRRAVDDPRLAPSVGAIVVDEPGRVLDADDVAAVQSVPVVGRFPVRPEIARAVDAGVLRDRLPSALGAPAAAALDRLLDAAEGTWAA